MQEFVDYTKFFSFHIFTFKLLGFWKPDEDMRYKRLYNFYTFFCTTIWVSFILSELVYMLYSFSNMKEMTAVIYVAGTITIDLIKMLAIYRNMDLIKPLLKELNNQAFQPKCKEHLDVARNVRKFHTILFYLCLYFGLQTYLCFSLVPFFLDLNVMLTPGWFPIDWSKSLNYGIIYVFQNVVILWNTLICLNLDTFTSGLLMQVGLQCDLLSITLSNIERFYIFDGVMHETNTSMTDRLKYNSGEFSRQMLENLIVCMDHYQKIKRLSKEIEDIHRTSVFILFLGGAMIICADLFQLSVVQAGGIEFMMFVSFLICMLMEQFMYCWFGNEIIFKSQNIFTSVYNTPWPDCDLRFRKIVLNFMTQTVNPIGLKAGGLFIMSTSAFVSVIKSSYSYFTLLQRLQEKESFE